MVCIICHESTLERHQPRFERIHQAEGSQGQINDSRIESMRRISQVTEAEGRGGGTMLCRGQQMPYLGEQEKIVPLSSWNKFSMDSSSWGYRWTRLEGYTVSAKKCLGAWMRSVDFILKTMGSYKRMQKTYSAVVTGKITFLLKRWMIGNLDELIPSKRPSQVGDCG